MQQLSPLRARLASFPHACALAHRLRHATGQTQFIVRTGNALQPVRVIDNTPQDGATVLALFL